MTRENVMVAPEAFPLPQADIHPRVDYFSHRMQPVSPLQFPDWNALVVRYPNYSFFHSDAWTRVLVETYGYTPRCFVGQGAGDIPALLPLMEVNSRLTGRRGIALPFTDDCEPLGQDHESFQKLFGHALEFGKSRGWKYIESRGGRKFFEGIPASLSFYGHRLDLAASEDQQFARLDNSVRRAIRKADKDGVTVEVSQSLEAMKIFYSLQCQTRQRHGLPPQPFSFFLNLHQHVLARGLGMVALCRHEKRPIAASVYFHLGDRAVFKYGASDAAHQRLRGNNRVMWEAIKWYLSQGMKSLHLGRTSLANEGLRRFKLGWGATEEKIEYFKYDLRQKSFVTSRDEVFGRHNRLFQSLPDCVSRTIGRALYRHWA